jgi:hypothetical protein
MACKSVNASRIAILFWRTHLKAAIVVTAGILAK